MYTVIFYFELSILCVTYFMTSIVLEALWSDVSEFDHIHCQMVTTIELKWLRRRLVYSA